MRLELPEVFRDFFAGVTNFLYPNGCFVCDELVQQQQLLCLSCFGALPKLCSKRIGGQSSLKVFSLFNYAPPFDRLVFSKFGQDSSLLTQLGRLLWLTPGLQTTMESAALSRWLVVPVPLHWQRRWWRGFNQAALLASGLEQASGLQVLEALKRHKNTKPQTQTTSKSERLENLKDAILLNAGSWFTGFTLAQLQQQCSGAGIILVDDLLTSGATLLACAQRLKTLNPAKIIAVTVCRG